jgi:deoxyadenosine/deoxycytidine kinase
LTTDRSFIVIAGNIGAGKTHLTQMLAEHLGWRAHYEPVDNNPYLTDFYRDMARWAFPLQVFFLTKRMQAHQAIMRSPDSAIQDRSIYEDVHIFARNLFAQGHLEDRDYQTYRELYESFNVHLRPPQLVIYLRKSVPVLQSRIRERGRDFEREISDDYLLELNRYYEDWIDQYQLGKKLILDSDELDFKNNPSHFAHLLELIRSV